MIPLGSVVEFESDRWHGRVFGRIDAIYLSLDRQPKEYWVENIDNGDFRPNQLVRVLEEGKDWAPKIPDPKFKPGDIVRFKDSDRTWLLVIQDAECRLCKAGAEWSYIPRETDALDNPLPWDEPVEEKKCKAFKV